MFTTAEDFHYDRLLSAGNHEIALLNEYKEINDFLIQNDWLFISPFYFIGDELKLISEISRSASNTKEQILNLTFNKFYNLPYTASFIEGYCARCEAMKPFLISIEHSLILTFQRDYEGAIKTIVPIIEGIIRKYLKEERSFDSESIRFENVRKSLDMLCEDLLLNYFEYLSSYETENRERLSFSAEQLKNLMHIETNYYDIWFSFVSDFVNKSFYLNTKGHKITNEINRHSILHEMGDGIEYNFENYIKIYFLLQFLTWVFLKKERRSLLNGIDLIRFHEKIAAYEKIINLSKHLVFQKQILNKNY